MHTDFLPTSLSDIKERGWNELDIILVSGDAYVDHPSYGVAVISRVLEAKGFKVGIIAQPDWRSINDFKVLGKPRLFFGVTSGNVDSMVANYTANKRLRKTDDYSPGGKPGMRPDRAVIVYAQRLREAFGRVPIVLGGIEASLRRLAHYDYWDNTVRRSILLDAKADILVYGMGEKQVVEIAQVLQRGEPVETVSNIRGTVIVRKDVSFLKAPVRIPSFEEARGDKDAFNRAFCLMYAQQNPFTAKPVVQQHADQCVIQLPPADPLTTQELDTVYALPYMRDWHPRYTVLGGIKGFETVRFSLISHRGCCGECAFCALYFHQGRIVQSRSKESLSREARVLTQRKDFKGTITDIGGPTANLYNARCSWWGTKTKGFCEREQCLIPEKCANLRLGYKENLEVYAAIKALPKVKHLFIESGFRYDLLNGDYAQEYLEQLIRYHLSGQMKVAPEYNAEKVLSLMNKPSFAKYKQFVGRFRTTAQRCKKDVYPVNYFINAHPGTSLDDAAQLALYLKSRGMHPEQIQDFIPLPMTVSACMYHTGKHPFTGERVYVPETFVERKMQRAMIQYRNPQGRKLIVAALQKLGKPHLIRKLLK